MHIIKIKFLVFIAMPLIVGAIRLDAMDLSGKPPAYSPPAYSPPAYSEVPISSLRVPHRAVTQVPVAIPMNNRIAHDWMKKQVVKVRGTRCSDILRRTACLHNCWLNMCNEPLKDDGVVPSDLQRNETVTTMAARIRAVGCCKLSWQTFLICCCCACCCQRPPEAGDSESVLKATISRLNCCNVCGNTACHCLCDKDGCCGECCCDYRGENCCGCGACCQNCCGYCCTCGLKYYKSQEYDSSSTLCGDLNDCCYECGR